MFTLTSLQIYHNCRYIKNLAFGVYNFGEYPSPNFYGENISIHVIVGKNGSGKSSLIDIVLRMSNNVGAIICKKEQRTASAKVCYIRYLYADLKYKFINEEEKVIHHCVLSIRDTALWLTYDNEVFWLSDNQLISNKKLCDDYIRIKKDYGEDHFHDYSDLDSDEKKFQLGKMFFYTVATNYSMLGFQSADYEDEESLEFDDSDSETEKNGNPTKMATWVKKRNWLNGIFHKNDGYMCPIVLNPFRDDGHINMKNEYSLTTDRLSALLIHEFKSSPVIDNYCLDRITYNVKRDFFERFDPKESEEKEKLSKIGHVGLFKEVAMKKGTWSWTILNTLQQDVEDHMSYIEVFARLYIVYKILNIAASYPSYSRHRKLGDINKVFSPSIAKNQIQLAELANDVLVRRTHIEQKFHQAFHFISDVVRLKGDNPNYDTEWCNSTFDFDTYCSNLKKRKEFSSVEDCMMNLPPSIFKKSIFLRCKNNDGTSNDGIPFNRMSSGQRQMLYQLTTIMYHLLNLKSVFPDCIRYTNINVVLDEIEVCFHPEYQRKFIYQILNLLVDRLHLNDYLNIHIWLTTHSPFILSDIPEQLVTYMDEGQQLQKSDIDRKGIRNPLAGNISELLHQSFFLENGFIGEFARKRVLDLLKFLTTGENTNYKWDIEKAKNFIDGIGDPYIKKQLHILLSKK